MAKKKEVNLEVITIGKPDIFALSESEQKVFFTTLLDCIIKVKQDERKVLQWYRTVKELFYTVFLLFKYENGCANGLTGK